MAIHEDPEKVVAWPNCVHAVGARVAARVYTGLGVGAVYLHLILIAPWIRKNDSGEPSACPRSLQSRASLRLEKVVSQFFTMLEYPNEKTQGAAFP